MTTNEDPDAGVDGQQRREDESDRKQVAPGEHGQQRAEEHAARCQYEAKQRRQTNRRRFLVDFLRRDAAAIQAISAMIVAGFTIALFCTAKAQMDEMHRQSDITKQALEVNQRAWVMLDRSPFTYVNPLSGRTDRRYSIKNFGHGPATGVKFWAVTLGEVPESFPNEPEPGGPATEGPGVLPPGDDTLGLLADFPEAMPVDRLPVVVGRVLYADQFNQSHETQFCLRMVTWGWANGENPSRTGTDAGTSGWVQCSRFNSAD